MSVDILNHDKFKQNAMNQSVNRDYITGRFQMLSLYEKGSMSNLNLNSITVM